MRLYIQTDPLQGEGMAMKLPTIGAGATAVDRVAEE